MTFIACSKTLNIASCSAFGDAFKALVATPSGCFDGGMIADAALPLQAEDDSELSNERFLEYFRRRALREEGLAGALSPTGQPSKFYAFRSATDLELIGHPHQ